MSKKKHKRSNPLSSQAAKRGSSTSKQKLMIGAALVGVLFIGGLIWANVNEESASDSSNHQADSRTLQPTTPPLTVTSAHTTGQPSAGPPQFEIKVNPQSGSATQPGSPLTITPNPPAAVPTTGSPAPDFALRDLTGKSVQLSKLKGKVVVVNFWATWCGPCRAEIPGFIKAYEKYRSKGLEIVGISMDAAGKDVVQEFVKKNGITYPVAIDMTQTPQKYGGIRGIPTTFIVDRQGKVAKQHVGYMDQTAFESMISPLL